MKIKNQKLIELFILTLANQICSVSEANQAAVKHIQNIGVRQQNTAKQTQKNRQPLEFTQLIFQYKISQNCCDNRTN